MIGRRDKEFELRLLSESVMPSLSHRKITPIPMSRQDSMLPKLPEKDFLRAPGDVLGDMIYILDKKAGIESGFVGISIKSEAYRTYVKGMIDELEKNPPGPNIPEDIIARYKTLKKELKAKGIEYDGMTDEQKIDLFLHDARPRHKVVKEERSTHEKMEMMKSGKYHEVFDDEYWVNNGMGGLLIRHYQKNNLKLDGSEHWSVAPRKFQENKITVYMVKQDYQSKGWRTFQETQNLLRTNTEKRKMKKKVTQKYFSETDEGKKQAFAEGFAKEVIASAETQRLVKSFQKSCHELNKSAIIETASTKVMKARGVDSQNIELVEGTRPFGKTKLAVRVGWNPDMVEFEDKLSGGNEGEFDNVVYDWEIDESGNPIMQPKYPDQPDNDEKEAKPILLGDPPKKVANPNFYNTGEAYILMLASGDRDFMGKAGQNKGFKKLLNGMYGFFGFDYGKSYTGSNKRLESLQDDFSFKEHYSKKQKLAFKTPFYSKSQVDMVNISVLADTPLIEKMKGVYLIAAVRGKLSPERAREIANEYRNKGDADFAKKLIEAAKPENKNKDIREIDEQINLLNTISEITTKEKNEFKSELRKMKARVKDADEMILKVFERRLELTPLQIEALDKLEKLTSPNVTVMSPDGEVYLNHIKVPRESRMAWQFDEKGNLEATFQKDFNIDVFLSVLQEIGIYLSKNKISINNENQKIIIQNPTEPEIKAIANLDESAIAKARNLDSVGLEYTENRRAELKRHQIPREEKDTIASSGSIPQQIEPGVSNSQGLSFLARDGTPPSTRIISAANQSFESVADNIKKAEHDSSLQISDVSVDRQKKHIDFQFEYGKNKYAKMRVQKDQNAVRYAVRGRVSDSDFQAIAERTAKIAIETCEPGTIFRPSARLSHENNTIVQAALQKAIKESIRFNNPALPKPIVEGVKAFLEDTPHRAPRSRMT